MVPDQAASHGSGIDSGGGHLTITNSIVALNLVTGLAGGLNRDMRLETGSVTYSNSLIGGGYVRPEASANYDSNTQSLIGVDPRLELDNEGKPKLADNGGPTLTIALLVDSPAINKANSCPATDQRGVYRPQGNGCDIGAFEYTTYNFEGFSAPVDNDGVLNIAKAGRSIPLKWRLLDANNNPVTTLSSATVTVTPYACGLSNSESQISESASGSSGLQNLGDGYYQFNWKTPTSYANSCKTMLLELDNGSIQTANFKFTK